MCSTPFTLACFVALSYHPLVRLFMFSSHIASTLTSNIDILTQEKYLIVSNYHLSRAFYISNPNCILRKNTFLYSKYRSIPSTFISNSPYRRLFGQLQSGVRDIIFIISNKNYQSCQMLSLFDKFFRNSIH